MKEETNYQKYRGKCKEMAANLVNKDEQLRLVRGHYFCPYWGKQAHWWCEDKNGKIIDPTKLQFPSGGNGEYIEFNGKINCEQCGKEVNEEEAHINGNYACCSYKCAMRLVGL
jgi:hypothetical protein